MLKIGDFSKLARVSIKTLHRRDCSRMPLQPARGCRSHYAQNLLTPSLSLVGRDLSRPTTKRM